MAMLFDVSDIHCLSFNRRKNKGNLGCANFKYILLNIWRYLESVIIYMIYCSTCFNISPIKHYLVLKYSTCFITQARRAFAIKRFPSPPCNRAYVNWGGIIFMLNSMLVVPSTRFSNTDLKLEIWMIFQFITQSHS